MILRLPVPPSVNAMFANSPNSKGRGRFKTGAYKEWLKLADAFLCPPVGPAHVETIDGAYSLEIRLPQRVRGDLDNRVKAIADFLVSRGVTPDDKYMGLLTVRRCPELDGLDCWVNVEAM